MAAASSPWLAGAAILLLASCATQPAAPIAAPRAPPPPIVTAPAETKPVDPPAVVPPVTAAEPAEPPAALQGRPGDLSAYLSGLKDVSCSKGTRPLAPQVIQLQAKRVPLATLNPARKTVGALTYVGGFSLTSTDKRFGGLSDLVVLPDGNLMSVTDEGSFVWIDLDKDGVTPTAARLSTMRGAEGQSLAGKANGDAEGLAVNDGLALVSFEEDHRILAFDIAGCGAAARGAPTVYGGFGRTMQDAFKAAHIAVPGNTAGEGLAVTADWYVFSGLEQQAGNAAPVSARPIEAGPSYDLRVEKNAPDLSALTLLPAGRDGKDARVFTLHRGLASLLDDAIIISETYFERWLDQSGLPANRESEIKARAHWRFKAKDTHRLAAMSLMFTIDNFEGIAAKELPDGTVRLYIISDDNFSSSQRTLFMVFDLPRDG